MLSKNNRLWGAILLVAGTTIGAGMLALPVSTGAAGFFPSLLLMSVIFLFMLMTALYFLEVNLKMKGESNYISMVKKTLHRPGEIAAWFFYLLLLYALTAAYLVGFSQIFSELLHGLFGFELATWLGPVIVTLIFAPCVYFGTLTIDILNRFLMIGLLASYALLFSLGIFHIDLSLLTFASFPCLLGAASIVVTSFGYHIIIPTLTQYLHHDRKQLVKAIVIGSLIPFVMYVSWQLLAMGIIPVEGECSLTKAHQLGLQATFYLKTLIGNSWVTTAARSFALFAIITSLLGISLSLTDFLSDGLKVKKNHLGKLVLVLMAFLPPLFFAIFYPKGFIVALKYAGICVVVLLAILPTLMAWKGRKEKKGKSEFRVFGGKSVLATWIVLSFVLLAVEVILL